MLKQGDYLKLDNTVASPSFTPASGSTALLTLYYSAGGYYEGVTNAEFPGQRPSFVDSSFSGSGQLAPTIGRSAP